MQKTIDMKWVLAHTLIPADLIHAHVSNRDIVTSLQVFYIQFFNLTVLHTAYWQKKKKKKKSHWSSSGSQLCKSHNIRNKHVKMRNSYIMSELRSSFLFWFFLEVACDPKAKSFASPTVIFLVSPHRKSRLTIENNLSHKISLGCAWPLSGKMGINTTKQYQELFNSWTYTEVSIKEKEMGVFRRLIN